jgi:tetratricopeptide (TPR) repeat protein
MRPAAPLLLLFFLACPAQALEIPFRPRPADGGLPGEWLTAFSAGARDAGMANASTALTGGEAAYANPAGIVSGGPSRSGEVVMMVAPLIAGGQYQALSVAHPVSNDDSLGISFLHLGSGSADRTDELGQSAGSFTEQDYAFLLTYAQRLSRNLSLGVSLKAVKQSMMEYSATGFGADAGMQARPFRNLTLGLSALNLFPPKLKLKEETDKFPVFFKAGAAYEYSMLDRPVLLCLDMNTLSFTGGRRVLRGGAAVEIRPFSADTPFLVRLGVNQREYAMGFSVGTDHASFDYAAAFHELETMHRFGITLRYDVISAFDERKIRNERLTALKMQARDWLRSGDYDKAEAAVARITEIDESDEDAPAITGEIKEIRDKRKAAARLEREKAQALTRLAEAKDLYRSRKYRMALTVIDGVIDLLRDNLQAQGIRAMSRAHILIDERNYRDAMLLLRKAVELEPDNREAALLYKRVQDIIDLQ